MPGLFDMKKKKRGQMNTAGKAADTLSKGITGAAGGILDTARELTGGMKRKRKKKR